ncbi:glycosyltransferase [Rosenbergiella epipactidis]|uniref:glycosyltransferase n=2 Tax=Rosenbergiella epipactidis TaxID=1544694 RepID=UPI001F4D369F
MTDYNVKVSILISLYNNEKEINLFSCLESLKNQTILASEVILVLDGYVKDSLLEIVNDFKSVLNIKIVKISENVGLGKALNYGLQFCNFNYVARMDTDDICLPDRLEKQMLFIFQNPDIDILGTSIIEFDEYDNKRKKELPLSKDEIREFSKEKNPFNHMTVIFKKSAVNSVGGYMHHHYMEDYNLWLRMIHKNMNTANLRDVTVMARVGKSMLLKRRGLKYLLSEYTLFKLKNNLKITNFSSGLFIFFKRSLSRIIPVFLLRIAYNMNRERL